MPRKRSPERDRAHELWLADPERTLASIAGELQLPEGRVRKWKCEDQWERSDKGTFRNKKKERSVSKQINRKLVASVEENEALTDKQRAFCLHYVKTFNATQAYLHAFGCGYDVANAEGYKLLVKPCLREEIKRLKEIKALSMLATGEDVVELHMRIAFSDMTHFASFKGGSVKLLPSTLVDGQLISKVKEGQQGASLELVDRQKSLAFLERYFELNPMDRHKKAYEDAKLAIETKTALPGGTAAIIPDSVWQDLMNSVYAQHLTDNRPTQIFFGGSSSGKSFAILGQRVVRDLMRGHRNYLVCRKTARTLRNSCFNEIKKCINRMELAEQFSINKSDMVITHKATGRQILFVGLDDVEKVKSVTPATDVLTDILIEEATEIDYGDYKQLRKRLRGGADGVPKRVTLLFNPVTQDHWIYKEFFAGRWDDAAGRYSDPELLILRTTYRDNRFLTPDDIAALEGETDKYYYDVYTLGKWGILGKLIFTNWTVKDLSELMKKEDRARNGLDFGFFPDPNAFVRCGYNKRKGEVYVYRTGGANYQDNAELAKMLQPIVLHEVVFCDVDQLNIHELNNFGIRAIAARKGPGSVEFGIKWLKRLKIFVDPACVEIIQELQKYKYKEDRDGNILPEPVDRDNHWIDALRYALESDMLETKVS